MLDEQHLDELRSWLSDGSGPLAEAEAAAGKPPPVGTPSGTAGTAGAGGQQLPVDIGASSEDGELVNCVCRLTGGELFNCDCQAPAQDAADASAPQASASSAPLLLVAHAEAFQEERLGSRQHMAVLRPPCHGLHNAEMLSSMPPASCPELKEAAADLWLDMDPTEVVL